MVQILLAALTWCLQRLRLAKSCATERFGGGREKKARGCRVYWGKVGAALGPEQGRSGQPQVPGVGAAHLLPRARAGRERARWPHGSGSGGGRGKAGPPPGSGGRLGGCGEGTASHTHTPRTPRACARRVLRKKLGRGKN